MIRDLVKLCSPDRGENIHISRQCFNDRENNSTLRCSFNLDRACDCNCAACVTSCATGIVKCQRGDFIIGQVEVKE